MAKAPSKKPLPASGRPQLRTITTFSPVPDENLAELTARLSELRHHPSPFADVPGTHFARLAVLGRKEFTPQPKRTGMSRSARIIELVTRLGRAQEPDEPSRSYLLFSANYDGDPKATDDRAYLDGLRRHLEDRADHIWQLCADYPSWSQPEAFATFFAKRTLKAGYLFSASDDEPTVEQIIAALKLRQKVIDLAVETDGMGDEELLKQLRSAFAGEQKLTATPKTEGAQLSGRPPAEPALFDPNKDLELLAGPDREIPTEPDLDDVQSLVTSGYPRHESAQHLLLRIDDPVAAGHWLTRVAEAVPTAGWADPYVDRLDYTSVERTAVASEGGSGSPGFAVHVALSHAGLTRLGLSKDELSGFSTEFRAGMASREPGLAPGRGIDPWRPPFVRPAESTETGSSEPGSASSPVRAEVDVLVMFSGTDSDSLADRMGDRPELVPTPADGVTILQTIQAGRIREDRHGPGDGVRKPGFLEHFGFVDGISQPRIHGVTPGRRAADLPAGEALLGYKDVDGDTAGAGLPTEIARNGSYLVYRKLEQDVQAFRELTRKLGDRLADKVEPGVDPEQLAAAKLMGRWRDGRPLVVPPTQQDDPQPPPGHFGFQENDAEGHGCPVGAHIRRANPRDSRPVDINSGARTGGESGLEATLALRHRMLRRGIPYGTPLAEDAEPDDQERGLLFVALVGDLRRQFEFVQAHWMSDGNAFRLGTDRDVLSGATEEGNKFVVQGTRPTFVKPTTPLVTCRGGEYFFLPGLTALRRIATKATQLPQSPEAVQATQATTTPAMEPVS